jgi:flagellar L-ring protein precursor FlgH
MRIIILFSVLFCISLSACSTYVEELASDEFAPVFPEENDTEQVADGAIFDGNAQGLFASERKASKVGDILTISLNESFQATKSQSATSGKDDSFGVTLPKGVFPNAVSTSVVRLYQNGNLEILGQKKLTLNNGDEYVRVKGIVRPQDIGNGNIVNSNRLANAEITYIGAGELADTSKKGWLSKVFSVVSPI